MKLPVTLLVLLLCCKVMPAQQTKQSGFETAVKEVVTAFKNQDSRLVKKYIHATTGVYILYRMGVYDQYKHLSTVNLADEAKNIVSLASTIAFSAINYQKLPRYTCDNSIWTKYGIFTDSTKTSYALSTVCKNLNEYLFTEKEEKIPAAEIKKYITLEKQSRRIVCCSKKTGEDLIFHLVYKNKRWYLWLVDKVLTDCSA